MLRKLSPSDVIANHFLTKECANQGTKKYPYRTPHDVENDTDNQQ